MARRSYKVTYSGTRGFDTFGTLKAAKDHAVFARNIGNSRPCVHRKLPSGAWTQVVCLKRRRVRKRAAARRRRR